MQDTPVAASALRKIYRRFIPLLFVCFVIAFLDRVNVGFAALTMNKDIGLSSTQFGFGAGIFFLTYFLFEVPSNIALEKFGARRWIARIMFTWGLLSAGMMFVEGPYSYYAIRLLLGIAEAGFFPGIIYFLSLWVPAASRAKMMAAFMASMPLASIIGSPISALLMQLDGYMGFHGWQWMFVIEAIPALLLTPVVLKVLRDKPEKADFLTADEQRWIIQTLAEEAAQRPSKGHVSILKLLKTPLVLALGLAYFGLVGINYGLSFFLPQIVRQFGYSIVETGFLAAIPFVLAFFGMTYWARRSDRIGERKLHLVLPLGLAIIGLTGSTLVTQPELRLAFLSLAALGTFSALPIWWTLPSAVLPAGTVAAGIAIVNSLGNLSGFTYPYALGAINDFTGSYSGGLQMIALIGLVPITVILVATRGTAWARNDGLKGKESGRTQPV